MHQKPGQRHTLSVVRGWEDNHEDGAHSGSEKRIAIHRAVLQGTHR